MNNPEILAHMLVSVLGRGEYDVDRSRVGEHGLRECDLRHAGGLVFS